MSSDLWFVIDVGFSAALRQVTALRLTDEQLAIKANNETIPTYMKRSIDECRVGIGLVPLWGFIPSYEPDKYYQIQRRRRLDRERKRRQRARMKGVQHGR